MFLFTSILSIHVLLLSVTTFTLWPEMTVYPYLMNNGFTLYSELINPYPPLFLNFLSIFTKVAGYDVLTFRILTYVIILLTDLTIFLISKKILLNSKLATFNLLFFVVFSIPFGINGLWFDLFQAPLLLLSFYFLLFSKLPNKYILASLFLGLSILVKQQAGWLIPIFLIVGLYRTKTGKVRTLLHLLSPLSILFLLLLLFVSFTADLKEFMNWAVVFPVVHASRLPGYLLLPEPKQAIAILAFYGAFGLFAFRNGSTSLVFVISLTLLIFAYPRFDYFHLVPSLALLSLVAGEYLLASFSFRFRMLFALILLVPIVAFQLNYYRNNIGYKTRFFEKEILEAGQIISEQSAPSDLFYIQNGPDQLLVLSSRLPVKPWADEFPWYLEYRNTNGIVLDGLSKQNPKFVVYKPYSDDGKYALGSYQNFEISGYLNNNYEKSVELPGGLWLKTLKTF